MSRRLHQLIACWFILQIVLPFTAPLQTLELHDLFGTKNHHAVTSPESTTTPTMSDASSAAGATSLLTPFEADGVLLTSAVGVLSTRGLFTLSRRLVPTPQVQRSVLRL